MCRRSKNLANRLIRHRPERHCYRRLLRRRRTQCSADRCSGRHPKHHRCWVKAHQPRANLRRAAMYLQSHSDWKNRRHFVRRSNPRSHPTGRWRRRQIHLASHRLLVSRRLRCRRPAIHRLAIRPNCRPTSRRRLRHRRTDRPRSRPDCRPGKNWMKTRRQTSHRHHSGHRTMKGNRPSSSSHRSIRRWACCWMNRRMSHHRRSIRRKNPTIHPRNRRSACSKASTMRKIAVAGGTRP